MIFRQITVSDGERPHKGLFISKGLFLLLLFLAALSSLLAVALFRGLRQSRIQPVNKIVATHEIATDSAITTKADPASPQISQIEINKIKEMLGQKRLAEALAAIESLSEKFPDNAGLPTLKIHALTHLGRLTEAETFISSALKTFPQSAELLVAAASFFHAINNPVAAEKMLLKALTIDPRMTGAMRGLVATYIRAGLFSMARDAAISGLRRVPGDPGLVNALADSLRMLGEWDNAIARYNELLLLAPAAGPDIHYHLGTCLRQKTETIDAALQSFKKAIKINPGFVPALNDLAMLLATSDKANEAIEYISPLLQYSNQAAFALDTAGLVFLMAGRINNALEMLKKTHATEPENLDYIIHLAAAYHKNGNPEDGMKLYNDAINKSGGDLIVLRRLKDEFEKYSK